MSSLSQKIITARIKQKLWKYDHKVNALRAIFDSKVVITIFR